METITITLNAKQAKALAHWVREFAYNYGVLDTCGDKAGEFLEPNYAELVTMFDDIQRAALALNPPKVRIMEGA